MSDQERTPRGRGKKLNDRLDAVESVAVPVALGVLMVVGIIGLLWGAVGDAMKQGLAVALLGVPLIFLYRSVHRQTLALAEHVAESATPPIEEVTLYDGLKKIADTRRGTRYDAVLLARTGERYLSDLRSIDPQWGALTVVLTDDQDAALWITRSIQRGWAQRVDVLISPTPSDMHYLVVGGDMALMGFFEDYGAGQVDYAQTLLVTPTVGETRALIGALTSHFKSRERNAEAVRDVEVDSSAP